MEPVTDTKDGHQNHQDKVKDMSTLKSDECLKMELESESDSSEAESDQGSITQENIKANTFAIVEQVRIHDKLDRIERNVTLMRMNYTIMKHDLETNTSLMEQLLKELQTAKRIKSPATKRRAEDCISDDEETFDNGST